MTSPRRGLRVCRQPGVEFHVETDTVVREFLSLPPFHREAGTTGHPARGGIVHAVAKLQPEELRIVESPAGHGIAGTGGYAPAACRRRRPVRDPPRGVTPIDRADPHVAENVTAAAATATATATVTVTAAAIDDGEGIRGVRSPLLATSGYPPLGVLNGIDRLDGLAAHEWIRERGHHRPGVLDLPWPQHQAGGGIHTIAHDASLPRQVPSVAWVFPNSRHHHR